MLIQARTKISIIGSIFTITTSLLLLRIELYYHEDCEYSQVLFNTISNLKINGKLTFKDILVNPDYAKELAELTGNETVPCLVTGDRPMKEGKDFRKYLVSHFM